MKTKRMNSVIMMAMLLGSMANAVAAEKGDLGKREYDSNCVLCHGNNLKGARISIF